MIVVGNPYLTKHDNNMNRRRLGLIGWAVMVSRLVRVNCLVLMTILSVGDTSQKAAGITWSRVL